MKVDRYLHLYILLSLCTHQEKSIYTHIYIYISFITFFVYGRYGSVLEVTPMVSSSHQELKKSERIGAISFEKCL